MGKHERIEEFAASQTTSGRHPACYELFFGLFNSGEYYEAHDVLEHLWLDCTDANARFYKGLIQIAGAFVHLRKQYLRPTHPTDGARLRPAFRLLRLGRSHISPFAPEHLDLQVSDLCLLCAQFEGALEGSDFSQNPWSPDRRPQIHLLGD